MNNRERMQAIVDGKPVDRMPFVSGNDNAAPNQVIWDALGRDSMGLLRGTYVHKVVTEGCRIVTEEPYFHHGKDGLKRTLHTPWGDLTEIHLKQHDLNTYAYVKHYVKDRKDLEILYRYLQASRCIPYPKYLEDNLTSCGDDGIVSVCMERTPYQQMWIIWSNLMDMSYLLDDEEDLMEACFDEMGRLLRQQADIVVQVAKTLPVSLVEFPENLTAPCLGKERFERYCVPFYREIKEKLGEGYLIGVHADGDTRSLADNILRSGLDFLESFTPSPDNDMPIEEAVRVWPDMALFINFTSSVHLSDPDTIYRTAKHIMEVTRGRKHWIQITESVPPERWRVSFPAILQAVKEFRD